MTLTIIRNHGPGHPLTPLACTIGPRITAPFTVAHLDALHTVAEEVADDEAGLSDYLNLQGGVLSWAAEGTRLLFAAVADADGMYVQVLRVLTDTTARLEADWPISLELPHETARTIWQLIGLYTL